MPDVDNELLKITERLDCALILLGDYELSGGCNDNLVSNTHEWKIMREEIDNLKRVIEELNIEQLRKKVLSMADFAFQISHVADEMRKDTQKIAPWVL